MDLCAKISCTLSAVATFFSTLATFTPEWIDFGNQLTEGLIQICVLEVCRNIKGVTEPFTAERSNLEIAVLAMMLVATASMFFGTMVNIYALLRQKYHLLKSCGLIQGIGGLSAFLASILFTVHINESTFKYLAYGYSYGLAWTGAALGLCAAGGNLNAESRRANSYHSV